jgi:hypothetical protein
MNNQVEFAYNDAPPSLNAIATRGNHWAVTNAKKKWQGIFEQLLMAYALPRGLDRVEALAFLRYPQKRRRDEGNMRWLLDKALGDALVNGGWLDDDTPEHFVFGRVFFEPERGPKRTTVVVHWHS